MNYQLLVLISLFFISCSKSSKVVLDETQNQREKSSKVRIDREVCYAHILTDDSYQITKKKFPIYTGDDVLREGVEQINILLEKERFKWIKVKTDTSECEQKRSLIGIWCRSRIPEQYVSKSIVRDTSSIKNFEFETFEERILIREGELLWREVQCNANVTPNLYIKVQQALLDNGYDIGPAGVDGIMAKDTKQALLRYQKDNGLPVGQLDAETLIKLGIRQR